MEGLLPCLPSLAFNPQSIHFSPFQLLQQRKCTCLIDCSLLSWNWTEKQKQGERGNSEFTSKDTSTLNCKWKYCTKKEILGNAPAWIRMHNSICQRLPDNACKSAHVTAISWPSLVKPCPGDELYSKVQTIWKLNRIVCTQMKNGILCTLRPIWSNHIKVQLVRVYILDKGAVPPAQNNRWQLGELLGKHVLQRLRAAWDQEYYLSYKRTMRARLLSAEITQQ